MSADILLLRKTVEPNLKAIDHICSELRSGIFQQIPRADRFPVELMLREALANAIVHGCASGEAARVWCEIERMSGGVAIRVGDSGAGFDWRSSVRRSETHAAESGRGLLILRQLSNTLTFNEKGNQVEVVRNFRRKKK